MINYDDIFNTAQDAFLHFKKTSGKIKANFLRQIASNIEAEKDKLIPLASDESNLPEGRITGELGRTVGQIKLFAQIVEEGSWLEAVIDHADPERTPAPKPDLRRFLTAIGPVVVFGASNFPLAFSTAGGDTISALAAGCPVIYKGHPAHPKTSLLVGSLISKAVQESGLPSGLFTHIEGGIDVGQELVKHPIAKAIAFTGSFKGGKAIFDLANQRTEPIPVYAEMGSVNPIITLENKLGSDIEGLAKSFASSLTLGAGQFCTNPGLIMVPQVHEKTFSDAVKKEIQEIAAAPMLHEGIAKAYYESLDKLKSKEELEWLHVSATTDLIKAHPALAKIKAIDWLRDDLFQEEVFGSFAIMVVYEGAEELLSIAQKLHGQLTITIWGEDSELEQSAELITILEEKCGRILFKGVPTGVEVGFAMQHGGPFPSTSDSRSTSVGAYAIKRFARPIAFQDMPEKFLPDALKESNPLEIWRTVDGEFKK
ncbi:aldehyde dehydrogenase (NADP(+)) [Belliella kenyensis]|uniref:Aldehyde dehydrogenase (NADP(+)) n=1 Tax=Belliella kenyensis TaxID=1472724 RepID=A0ABV8EI66_9BACT|nr:aldehyde dehydrogenase (NADP(+)) [Belliella kenyensis]MCH7401317.1 aldehyde dehydrogenase (NADP(+)) [Belliella kenyensis]MDN3602761.1 aldehyde dehydrogenase (NADP(+)) [Belliella kenyensis]